MNYLHMHEVSTTSFHTSPKSCREAQYGFVDRILWQLVLLRLSSLWFLLQYFRTIILYDRDISCAWEFVRHFHRTDSPPVYSIFSMLHYMPPLAANNVQRVIVRPWLSSVSTKYRRNCLWSQVAGGPDRLYDNTITSVCVRCGLQFSVLCSVWM